jgi:hypothetical protein
MDGASQSMLIFGEQQNGAGCRAMKQARLPE